MDRKRQEDIEKWIKKEREKGKKIEAGFGRVRMDGKNEKR